ncbi:hypothetical protein C0992_005749 [Termitomyces sp. T32_za158]|nr:hypothetical protein C0992_005749 [Termitomyces sp. T32_za158]
MQVCELRQSRRVQDHKEARDVEAEQLAQAQPELSSPIQPAEGNDGNGPEDHEIMVADALVSQQAPMESVGVPPDDFLCTVCRKYAQDILYAEILQHAEAHPRFCMDEQGIIWITNLRNRTVAHEVVGHFGTTKTLEYLRQQYWWPQMHAEVDKIPMTEFAINASVSETTRYAPFELNGGYMPSMIREIRSDDVLHKGVKDFALQALENLASTHDAIIAALYDANDDTLFPNRVTPEAYDFGAGDDQEWFVEEIKGHWWHKGTNLELEVQWSAGDTTWESYTTCAKLTALDWYLELQGVKRPSQLAKRPQD